MTRLFVVVVLAIFGVLVWSLTQRISLPTPVVETVDAPAPAPDATVAPAYLSEATSPPSSEGAGLQALREDTLPTTELQGAVGPATIVTKAEPVEAPRQPARGEVADVIRAGFAQFGPDVSEQAVRVGQCESTLRPGASNAGSYGVMQIAVRYHLARIARLGYTPDDMFDATANIAVAADIYANSGWNPWTCRYVLGLK